MLQMKVVSKKREEFSRERLDHGHTLTLLPCSLKDLLSFILEVSHYLQGPIMPLWLELTPNLGAGEWLSAEMVGHDVINTIAYDCVLSLNCGGSQD